MDPTCKIDAHKIKILDVRIDLLKKKKKKKHSLFYKKNPNLFIRGEEED
jgi:hypothetical protein